MKVFFITSRFPFPIEKGDKLRAYHHIKQLSRNHKVYLYATSKSVVSFDQLSELKKYCQEVTVFTYPGIKGIFRLGRLLKGLPLQVLYFFSSDLNKKLEVDFKKIKPDYVHFHLIRTGEYLKSYQEISSIDFMDAFSKSLDGLSRTVSLFHKPVYFIESKLVRLYERRLLNRFKNKFAISDRDANHLNEKEIHNIVTLKNGLDLKFYKPQKRLKKYDIVFVGNLGYEPNYQAVRFIHNLAQKLPTYTFLIAGARAERLKKIQLAQNISVEGWFEDIREAYSAAKISIAPIFYGTGMQNKILESMAMGTPCITTSYVNRAIGGTHKSNIFIADTLIEFEQAVIQLFNDQKKKESIAKKGHDFVNQHFSWDRQTIPLLKCIEINEMNKS